MPCAHYDFFPKKFGGQEIIAYFYSLIDTQRYEKNPIYHWVVEERVLQQAIGS